MVDKVEWASDMNCFVDGHVAVRIDGKNNLEEFLSLCDEHDLRFKDGSKAMSVCESLSKIIGLNECVYMAHIVIGAKSWLAFSAGANVFGSCTVIDVQDMLKQERKNKTYYIGIECNDGKNTNAIMLVNGKMVNKVEARCRPDDKFDFAVGAQVALDRLYGKEVIKPKEEIEREFKVGDRVECVSDTACNVAEIIGKCGTVMNVDNDNHNVRVKFDEGFYLYPNQKRDYWWLCFDDLIHID